MRFVFTCEELRGHAAEVERGAAGAGSEDLVEAARLEDEAERAEGREAKSLKDKASNLRKRAAKRTQDELDEAAKLREAAANRECQ